MQLLSELIFMPSTTMPTALVEVGLPPPNPDQGDAGAGPAWLGGLLPTPITAGLKAVDGFLSGVADLAEQVGRRRVCVRERGRIAAWTIPAFTPTPFSHTPIAFLTHTLNSSHPLFLHSPLISPIGPVASKRTVKSLLLPFSISTL